MRCNGMKGMFKMPLWARWAPNLTHMNACDGCPRAIYTFKVLSNFVQIEFYGSST